MQVHKGVHPGWGCRWQRTRESHAAAAAGVGEGVARCCPRKRRRRDRRRVAFLKRQQQQLRAGSGAEPDARHRHYLPRKRDDGGVGGVHTQRVNPRDVGGAGGVGGARGGVLLGEHADSDLSGGRGRGMPRPQGARHQSRVVCHHLTWLGPRVDVCRVRIQNRYAHFRRRGARGREADAGDGECGAEVGTNGLRRHPRDVEQHLERRRLHNTTGR
mmetsp:Transcript_37964/g.94101  ORF Transcript_37964/g.94101 Transcript_37964/m.94101 type:complete len:215 (+) Transcript_37964:5908-6552(+)